MTPLAPVLQAFFLTRLLRERQASPHTISAYRDTFRLVLAFAQTRTGKTPSQLRLSDLDQPVIGAFLEHLESERGNTVRTRNARLAAIHSFFKYAALQEPAHAAVIQRVLAIPQKRASRRLVTFLTRTEVDALLAAPDRTTWIGRRDHALLLLAVQTGLRVSELVRLRGDQIAQEKAPHIRCLGKGRKERCTPLTRGTLAVIRKWLDERDGPIDAFVFPSRRGSALSTDAVRRAITKYASAAARSCQSLARKTVSPHVLRHTTAVHLLEAGVDRAVIALWLGHESVETTQVYLDASLAMKEKALAKAAPSQAAAKRYKPGDQLLAFLNGL